MKLRCNRLLAFPIVLLISAPFWMILNHHYNDDVSMGQRLVDADADAVALRRSLAEVTAREQKLQKQVVALTQQVQQQTQKYEQEQQQLADSKKAAIRCEEHLSLVNTTLRGELSIAQQMLQVSKTEVERLGAAEGCAEAEDQVLLLTERNKQLQWLHQRKTKELASLRSECTKVSQTMQGAVSQLTAQTQQLQQQIKDCHQRPPLHPDPLFNSHYEFDFNHPAYGEDAPAAKRHPLLDEDKMFNFAPSFAHVDKAFAFGDTTSTGRGRGDAALQFLANRNMPATPQANQMMS